MIGITVALNKTKKEDKKSQLKYYVMTVQHEGKAPKTIVDYTKDPSRFLAIQYYLGFKTVILWSAEITKESYDELLEVLSKAKEIV
jgi:hypothetical protein